VLLASLESSVNSGNASRKEESAWQFESITLQQPYRPLVRELKGEVQAVPVFPFVLLNDRTELALTAANAAQREGCRKPLEAF
jgi:hypothetical protein